MTDQELLSAISNMLDKKIEPLKQDICCLTRRMDALDKKVECLTGRMDALDKKVECLTGRMDALDKKVECLTGRMDSLEKEVRRNSLILENDVLPRLQTIEKLYVDSSKIYMEKVKQIDDMQNDIDTMKVVIQEHSEKLEKIS